MTVTTGSSTYPGLPKFVWRTETNKASRACRDNNRFIFERREKSRNAMLEVNGEKIVEQNCHLSVLEIDFLERQ